jgi:hypothetical protein
MSTQLASASQFRSPKFERKITFERKFQPKKQKRISVNSQFDVKSRDFRCFVLFCFGFLFFVFGFEVVRRFRSLSRNSVWKSASFHPKQCVDSLFEAFCCVSSGSFGFVGDELRRTATDGQFGIENRAEKMKEKKTQQNQSGFSAVLSFGKIEVENLEWK